jgi:hypothetical protein
MENRQGKLIGRRFYRPAPLACAYVRGVGLTTQRYWRYDGDSIFRCVSPVKELGTVADPLDLGLKNALSYHVDGDAERIHKMLLHLNINQRHEAKHAIRPLCRRPNGSPRRPFTRHCPRRRSRPSRLANPGEARSRRQRLNSSAMIGRPARAIPWIFSCVLTSRGALSMTPADEAAFIALW